MDISKKLAACFVAAVFTFNITVKAQEMPAPTPLPPQNWHIMDLKADGYYGVSLARAYEFLKGKKSKTVVVAIVDSGIDTLQKDFTGLLWTNPKEIPGNGKDDDGNGYVDDIHGWNFLGGPGNKCDYNETTEEVREYNKLKDKWTTTPPATANNKEYQYWLTVKATYDSTVTKSKGEIEQLSPLMNVLVGSSTYIKRELHLGANDEFRLKDLDKITSTNDTVKYCKNVWESFFTQEGPTSSNVKVIKDLNEYLTKLNNDVNPDLEARKRIIGDNPDIWDDKKGYGNNQLKFPDAMHGTMVAGFIGAKRDNGYGIDGVANDVRIMAVKAVPNGDEYDKDIAHAIRYAVDNGAKVINMSFGKKISPHKEWVDAAFKYAEEHDVLLVHAAGNDNQDVDAKPDFPDAVFTDGTLHNANVINVGASGPRNDTSLAADFSNYGQKSVDVFAPGVKVTSVTTDAELNTEDGTSFASPITAGIAALILEYYPNLSSKQVKAAILQSAKPLTGTKVNLPGKKGTLVDFTSLSKTGGIVNAYDALVIASKMKGERKK